MRFPRSPLRRLASFVIRFGAQTRNALRVPLRWPRVTTRQLMVLVAVAAVVLWAVPRARKTIDWMIRTREKMEHLALREREFEDGEPARLAKVRALQDELDQVRRDTGTVDQLTENYLAERLDSETAAARYCIAMAKYHQSLIPKYRRAMWHPWESVPPDPPQPPEPPPRPDPFAPPPSEIKSGEIYYATIDGGRSVAYSPDGRTLAVGCRDKTVRLLEPNTGKLRTSFTLTEGDTIQLAFSPDGRALVGVGEGKLVQPWEVATGRAGRPLNWSDRVSGQKDPLMFVTAVSFSPDGETIALAAFGLSFAAAGVGAKPPREFNVIRLFNVRTCEMLWEHTATGGSTISVAFSPDGQMLACANGGAMLLDARTGLLKKTLKPAAGYVLAVAFSPDGRMLAGAGSDLVPAGGFGGHGRVTLWDVSTEMIVRTLEGPSGRAQTVAFSPDGRLLAAGGTGAKKKTGARADSEVILWDTATWASNWSAEGGSEAVVSLAFSREGRSLVFCDDEYVFRRDSTTGQLKQILMKNVYTYKPNHTSGPGKKS
jgi:WD40 repeat protein